MLWNRGRWFCMFSSPFLSLHRRPHLIPPKQDGEDNPYHCLHLPGHDHAVRTLAARGRTLVSGSYDCTVRIWDIITGEQKWVLVGHTQKGFSLSLSLSSIAFWPPFPPFLQFIASFSTSTVNKPIQAPWMALSASGLSWMEPVSIPSQVTLPSSVSSVSPLPTLSVPLPTPPYESGTPLPVNSSIPSQLIQEQ